MRVTDLSVDPEFAGMTGSFAEEGVRMNPASAREHVAGVERKTRLLKERIRCRWSQLPYEKIPSLMVSELAKDVVGWLNQFPTKSGIYSNVGLRTIMSGIQYDYRKHCRVEFGQYYQVHEDKENKNRVDLSRTTGAIALKSSGNLQGGYRFMNLTTGGVITWHHFTEVPITDEVIKRVHELADRDQQTEGVSVVH